MDYVRRIVCLYDWMKTHPRVRWVSLLVLTAALVVALMQQTYKEDISDFLPLDQGQQEAFDDYQHQAGARRIFIILQPADQSAPEADGQLTAAVERYEDLLAQKDTTQAGLECIPLDSPEMMDQALAAAYGRMPYLLTYEDYARMDSLLASDHFVTRQLEQARSQLMLPTGAVLAGQIARDPLNLFTPVLQRLHSQTAIRPRAHILTVDSPYGASETSRNALLTALLQEVADSVVSEYPRVGIHLTGGPVIAVGNAQQIKTDSTMAITLAVLLIMVLLWVTLRNVRNILLIAVSTAWGWLFAMGCLSLIHSEVSIIVIGISSVIVGIAVNYPLHLIDHLSHTPDMRSALKEIAMPLMVGNITTVGAFMALVPLDAAALRDLGLFSALLLVGTMLFVLIWLPHMAKVDDAALPNSQTPKLPNSQTPKLPSSQTPILLLTSVITVVLGVFSMQTSFDADLRNINYMTDRQRQDMEAVRWLTEDAHAPRLPDAQTPAETWEAWRTKHAPALEDSLRRVGREAGFAPDAFDGFFRLLSEPAAEPQWSPTEAIVNHLTDNFNYIGWACGCLVFVFLWCSLGSIELALLAFLPMAVSWIWILGIMALLDIQFNVVNIILATFIFGQGDDYTIFVTEGCQYEYAYRKKILHSYLHSISLSALIMFIGIGALIISRHPALHSLAVVTIIGMLCVVLTAWLLPPVIFRWLVSANGTERRRPLTLRGLLRPGGPSADHLRFVADCYRYRGVEISAAVNRSLRRFRSAGCARLIAASITPQTRKVVVTDSGWGETALALALAYPQLDVVACDPDEEKCLVATYAAAGRVPNMTVLAKDTADVLQHLAEPKEEVVVVNSKTPNSQTHKKQ